MNQPLTLQIRTELVNFVAGRQTLHEFEQWFNMHALTPVAMGMAPEAEDLVYEIELRISEFAHGDWTEEQLRDMFRQLSQQSIMTIASEAVPPTGTSTVITRSSVGFPGSLVHI